ncbi:MAG TPA: hypothetical protein VFH78_08055 [Candidatus Thermoplasmatota archaeon]|nr:hypothetical protein [Candidatus Thermoplasmatota archaeon]
MKLKTRFDEVNEAGINLEAAVVAAATDAARGRFSRASRRRLELAVRAMLATDELLDAIREES